MPGKQESQDSHPIIKEHEEAYCLESIYGALNQELD
jgi:hypothetical protein